MEEEEEDVKYSAEIPDSINEMNFSLLRTRKKQECERGRERKRERLQINLRDRQPSDCLHQKIYLMIHHHSKHIDEHDHIVNF